MSQDRLPPIPQEQWTEEQRKYAQVIIDGPRGGLISPFVPLLRSPELMDHAGRMGEYLRYRSTLELRLSEFAILLVARHWSQQVEWAIHAPIALKAGVAAATVEAIGEGRRPTTMAEDEADLYEFCTELHVHRGVSQTSWDAVVKRFGEKGAIDLVGITGYYVFLSMVMNAAHTEVPSSMPMRLPSLTGG